MAYFKVCPYCGGTLDPEEKCDCRDEKKKQEEFYDQHLKMNPRTGQMTFYLNGKEAGHAGKNIG